MPARSDDEGAGLRRVEFGVRYMPTFTSVVLRTSNGQVNHGSVSLTHGAGLMLALNVTRHIGLQAELNYYQVSQSYTDANINRSVRLRYINIPLLLTLNTSKTSPVNLNVVAGPQFGFNVGSNLDVSGGGTDSVRAVVAVKKRDVGIAYGFGLEFALNNNHTIRLDCGYRGFYGLVDMDESTANTNNYNIIVKTSRKTNSAYIGLAFLF